MSRQPPANIGRYGTVYGALLLVAALLLSSCGTGITSGFSSNFRSVTAEGTADIVILSQSPPEVATVRPVPLGLTMPKGGVAVFTAVATDSAGRFLSDAKFEWSMRALAAGSVTPNGVFTAGTLPGSFPNAIQVEAYRGTGEDGPRASALVSVVVRSDTVETSISSVFIFPDGLVAQPGDIVPLLAAVLGPSGGLVQDVVLEWRVRDPSVGTINASGLLTIGSLPSVFTDAVEVRATRIGSPESSVMDTMSVEVITNGQAAGLVRSIIGPLEVTGSPGALVPLVFLAFDPDGKVVEIGPIIWEVADPRAGEVDDLGRFRLGTEAGRYPNAVRGSAALLGQYEGRRTTASVSVTVRSADAGLRPAVGLPQIIPETLRANEGERRVISALYFDADGLPVVKGDVEWSVDPELATIDESGRLTALGPPGRYPGAIIASVPSPDGQRTELHATLVIVGELARVEVVPSRVSLAPADPLQLSALAFDVADNRLFDVRFDWRLAPGTPGTLASSGLYIAGDRAGEYRDGVVVRGVQRR
ncbi:MAG: hypothetical protein V3S98_03445 [Dehalococcoidia bacterium]